MRWLDGITDSMDMGLGWVGPGKPNLPLGLRGKAGGGARAIGKAMSSVHGILQARILEWVAISFSRLRAYSNSCPSSR